METSVVLKTFIMYLKHKMRIRYFIIEKGQTVEVSKSIVGIRGIFK